jgi:Carbohydrate binding module (family 6)
MKRILVMMGLLVVSMAPLEAQTLPTGVAFDVNTTQHNSSTVTGYKIYIVIGTKTVRVTDVGKPTPSSGTITHVNPALFSGLVAGSYTVHSTAYGPGGESGASNKASFTVGSGTTAPLPPPDTEPPAPPPTDPEGDPVIMLVQAENFDNGGQNVGYYDRSRGNEGGAYRDTHVDISQTNDSGGGYCVGWTAAEEWLNYTVDVAARGTYEFQVRVASGGEGGTFHIEVDGVDRTGPIKVPKTGGWQIWTTIRRSNISLQAGRQLWRVVMDDVGRSTGAVGNINWIRAVPQ